MNDRLSEIIAPPPTFLVGTLTRLATLATLSRNAGEGLQCDISTGTIIWRNSVRLTPSRIACL